MNSSDLSGNLCKLKFALQVKSMGVKATGIEIAQTYKS